MGERANVRPQGQASLYIVELTSGAGGSLKRAGDGGSGSVSRATRPIKLWRELTFELTGKEWRKMLYAAVAGAGAVFLVVMANRIWENAKPAVFIHRDLNEFAIVRGTSVEVWVDQIRVRPACGDAHADRAMLHFAPGVALNSDNFDAIIYMRENRVVPTLLGEHKFRLFLTLQQPLPKIDGGTWAYQTRIYQGCDWFSALFGDNRPVLTQPTPAKIIN
jgi:hypothetical protein